MKKIYQVGIFPKDRTAPLQKSEKVIKFTKIMLIFRDDCVIINYLWFV